MQAVIRRAGAALVGLLVSGFLGAAVARAETLVIAADIWCPINCSAAAEQRGIFVELAEQIFAEHGIRVEYRTLNWARALHETRSGRIDAVIGAGVRDAPDFLFGETPTGISQSCFYARPERAWRYQGVDSLSAVTLGAINGYAYSEELDNYIRAHHARQQRVQLVSGDHALAINVDKVLHGRVDVTLENRWVMEAFRARSGEARQLVQVGCLQVRSPIYLAFSPVRASSARYLTLYQDGLRRFQEDGRYERIMQRYGVSLAP
ncbi:transporter substrate-binding domain-containing protein [Pseudomonas sp. GD03944]|uniref:substrate-binding periplasmic protein n=1 Tax=Pseudomonas sp. GD03944 TaxID=2975409 RepID=UPI00244D37AD|nr:transporter substrate-binding domain-containing protein [Pseudomonas sp. GD03944]MDH1264698.1 transporter substrate-binding domain-containing protein [Pseudomonas sp. GD03944]